MSNQQEQTPQDLTSGELEKLIYERISKNVKEYRKRTKLSQEKFAESCQLDRTHIGYIEQGRRNPTIKTLVKIATFLEVDLTELLK